MGGDNLSGSRLMLVLLFLVSMVSVVAVIVAAVSLTSSGSDTPNINVNSGPASTGGSSGSSNMPLVINGGGSGSGSSGKRVFKVAIGHDYGGDEYLNSQGYVSGFTKDLIYAVCNAGGLDCRVIWDEYTNCWNSEPGKHSFGGPGLFGGWYDACAGWVGTVGRSQVFDFSLPYAKSLGVWFYVQKTTTGFDGTDITGMKVGFIDGFSTDEKCLARQDQVTGSVLKVENIIHYTGSQQALDGLKNGEVDVLFGSGGTFDPYSELKRVGAETNCAIQGVSLMLSKDNDFDDYWNAAFQKLRDSGDFRKLCENVQDDHGHIGALSPCVDAP